jgi:hypothetical protein
VRQVTAEKRIEAMRQTDKENRMGPLMKALVGGVAVIAAAAGAGGVVAAAAPATTPTDPVTQEGLVNLNLTGVTVQLPIALAADLCDVTVDVLVNELDDGSAPCDASSNSDAVVATEDGGPVSQEGLVNVNVTDVVVQAPISIAANVCDVTVAVLVSRLQDGASPCDATGTADAITATESGPPAAPVEQEGLVNLNLTGVTVQLPVALAANVCDVEVAVLVDDLSDGSAPCNASSNSDAAVTTPDGGPVSQDGLVNVNLTDVVVQVPISLAANVCDVSVAVLTSTLEDAASPCDATATAEAITPADGSVPVDAATDSVVEELPVDSVVEQLPVTVPELPVTLPTD